MDKYFDGELLSGFEESPKTTTSRYEQLGYCEYRDVKTGLVASNYIEVMNQQFNRIADLEAKLAESENQIYELQTKLNLKEYAPAFCSLAGRDCESLGKVDQIKHQLEEKDKAIEGLQEINQSLGQTCNNDAKEIGRLREQLHTANQETLHFQNKYFAEKQIAIEELEKVKELLIKNKHIVLGDFDIAKWKESEIEVCRLDVAIYEIDQQIRVMKGEE